MHNLEDLVILAKKRGFIFQSSEIYGGYSGVYDYGPIGVELLNNIKNNWWKNMVQMKRDIVGIDSGIIMNSKVWESSGHTKGFNDIVVYCKKTNKKYRADHLLEEIGIEVQEGIKLDEFIILFNKHKDKIKLDCDFDTPAYQNLLVKTNIADEETYLRGETCQGIYVNFKQIIDSMHMKLPFGVAQIGKAFRNEISPRQFIFRTREFEQMEMQYFSDEKDSDKYFKEILEYRMNSLEDLGIKKENLRVREHEQLVFYAKKAVDIEYNYPFGWRELEGIHNRGDYDLKIHTKCSGEKLTYFDQDKNEHVTPHINESSIGVGRLMLAILNEAYTKEKLDDGTERIVLKIKPKIAPIKIAVLPLMKKDKLPEIAEKVFSKLSKKMTTSYDDTGSIGKRYRRADETGTPFAITIDYDTKEDNTVTVRDRDSMLQERVKIEDLEEYINNKID